jgi:hypothetical protein
VPQSLSGRFGEEKNLQPVPGFRNDFSVSSSSQSSYYSD